MLDIEIRPPLSLLGACIRGLPVEPGLTIEIASHCYVLTPELHLTISLRTFTPDNYQWTTP